MKEIILEKNLKFLIIFEGIFESFEYFLFLHVLMYKLYLRKIPL